MSCCTSVHLSVQLRAVVLVYVQRNQQMLVVFANAGLAVLFKLYVWYGAFTYVSH